jgi:hypothetical protein
MKENMVTNEKRNAIASVMVMIGLFVMVVMALMPLLNVFQPWLKWAFAAGAFIVLAGRAVGAYTGPVLRIRRLHRILMFSALLYCASAAMMFIPDMGNNWMGFLLAGVLVQMYASWMIDKEMKKSEK